MSRRHRLDRRRLAERLPSRLGVQLSLRAGVFDRVRDRFVVQVLAARLADTEADPADRVSTGVGTYVDDLADGTRVVDLDGVAVLALVPVPAAVLPERVPLGRDVLLGDPVVEQRLSELVGAVGELRDDGRGIVSIGRLDRDREARLIRIGLDGPASGDANRVLFDLFNRQLVDVDVVDR